MDKQKQLEESTERSLNERTSFRLSYIAKFIGAGKLLDIGCGNAYLKDFLPGSVEYYGVDFVQRKGNEFMNFSVVDITKDPLPFRDNTFDYVVASEVLEHISNFFFAVEQIYRVLKSGGQLIITVPNISRLYWSIRGVRKETYRRFYLKDPAGYGDHIHAFDESTLGNLLRLIGFKVIDCDRFYNDYSGHRLPEIRLFNPFAFHILLIGEK